MKSSRAALEKNAYPCRRVFTAISNLLQKPVQSRRKKQSRADESALELCLPYEKISEKQPRKKTEQLVPRCCFSGNAPEQQPGSNRSISIGAGSAFGVFFQRRGYVNTDPIPFGIPGRISVLPGFPANQRVIAAETSRADAKIHSGSALADGIRVY